MTSTDTQSARVSIQRLDTYDAQAVREKLTALLMPLGGMRAFVKQDAKTVLKPNFLRPALPEKAVTTHPEIIAATAFLAEDAGAGSVTITDSPGLGTATKCARRAGLLQQADPRFSVVDANDGEDFVGQENHFHRLKISKMMRTADALINLPKVKTHGQMVLTGAVKNCFGAVVGLEKVQWHMRSGRDPMDFARLVNHIHTVVSPALNIIDGVVGMEGNGPNSGTPRPLGLIMASDNAHALDAVLAEILGIDPMSVYTLRAAREADLLPPQDHIEILGPTLPELKLRKKWALARPVVPRVMMHNKWLASFLEEHLKVAPKITHKECTRCEQCIECCAAGAMTNTHTGKDKKKGKILINTEKCISCFCCQEMCPTGAITISAGLLARMMRLGIR